MSPDTVRLLQLMQWADNQREALEKAKKRGTLGPGVYEHADETLREFRKVAYP